MSENKEDPKFVIKDHRHSQQSEGEIKKEEASVKEEKDIGETQQNIQDFEIDFSTFVLSLTSSAFYHLGDVPDPNSGNKKIDLVAVKQTIDILSMLKGKTEGNLSPEEAKLMEQVIYELQVKYVEKNKQS